MSLTPPFPFSTVTPLVLVSAVYDHNDWFLTLVFDRPVNIAAFDGSQILVKDGAFNAKQFTGETPAELLDPTTVFMNLVPGAVYLPETTTMDATALTGIVAVDDGGAWPGVTNMELPFP